MVPTSKHIIAKAVLIANGACIVIGLVCCIGYCSEMQQIQYQEPVQKFHDTPATQDDINYWKNYKKEQEKPKQVNASVYPPITKSSGKYLFGGYECKYYSSNVSRHCRISEGDCDKDFWRDKDGYFVVAICDKQAVDEERIIPIADGIYGKVYDFCETPGVIDIYTAF